MKQSISFVLSLLSATDSVVSNMGAKGSKGTADGETRLPGERKRPMFGRKGGDNGMIGGLKGLPPGTTGAPIYISYALPLHTISFTMAVLAIKPLRWIQSNRKLVVLDHVLVHIRWRRCLFVLRCMIEPRCAGHAELDSSPGASTPPGSEKIAAMLDTPWNLDAEEANSPEVRVHRCDSVCVLMCACVSRKFVRIKDDSTAR